MSGEELRQLTGDGMGGQFGAGVYLFKKIPCHHAVWHLLVLAGSACHYFVILGNVLP